MEPEAHNAKDTTEKIYTWAKVVKRIFTALWEVSKGGRFLLLLLCLQIGMFASVFPARAQLNEHCTVSVLNRTARVRPDGSWVLANVPANFGRVRARATCGEAGVTQFGQSDFLTIPANGSVGVSTFPLGVVDPVPASLTLTTPTTTLITAGATTQLSVTATLPGGNTRDVTAANSGTSYTTSNRAVATVSADGLITAVASGSVIVSALNEGALGLLRIQVVLTGGDTDGDGIPGDVELANGLNPNDPADASQDADNDGLTNKQELIAYGTNPRVADTDGDGVRDSLEVQTGSNPLDPRSINLGEALVSIELTPASGILILNIIIGEASKQLTVIGHLRDSATIDLTSATQGTTYSSSDVNICSVGPQAGRVFAGTDGTCIVTATNSGFTATATVTVQSFAPTALSSIPMPGYANNVDVSGHYAYVAAGAAGLQVVDVTDPRNPRIVGAVDTPGNASDVRIVGNLAYIADGSAGLQIINVSSPANPVIVGAMDTPGEAQDVMVSGSRAYVADGDAGLQVVDVSNPTAPRILGALDTPGIARGVAVAGELAIMVEELPTSFTATLRVIDTTNPAHPQIVGSTNIPGGQAKDVVVRNTLAYVASSRAGGVQIVDFSTPASPRSVGALASFNGFAPQDVELAGQFAFGTDQFSPSAVGIADVSDPTNPLYRARLDFSAFGNYVGTGLALSPRFVYMTGASPFVSEENGSTGDTRLLIGQYVEWPEDTAGSRPSIQITAPTSGDTATEGAALPITVEAVDDVAVVSVDFLVNGQAVFTGTHGFTFLVPSGVTSLTLGARATDPAGNIGVASDIVINVVSDTFPPTVRITSVDPGDTVMEGGTLTYYVTATDDVTVASVDFLVNGQVVDTVIGAYQSYYEYFTVPVGVASLTLGARATDTKGNVGVAVEVVVTVIPDPPPSVSITSPTPGATVIENDTLPVSITATDNTAVTAVNFLVNGAVVFTDTTSPYQATLTVPVGSSSLALGATAVDTLGKIGTAADVVLNVIPDPLTTAVGRVLDQVGSPVVGASVTCRGISGLTGADGTFSIAGVPTIREGIRCEATWVLFNGVAVRGRSASMSAVRGGTTAVGDIGLPIGGLGSLYPGPKFVAGDLPVAVAVADLNEDGALDVVVANKTSRDLSVLLGHGDGTFAEQQRLAVGVPGISAVVAADLNLDGHLDLAVASGCVTVLLGDGNGVFTNLGCYALNVAHAVAVTELNGDGLPDLVTADPNSNTVSVLAGNGDGTFRTPQDFAVGNNPVAIAVGDLNGDGRPDLVTANSSSDDVSVLLGNGNGTFAPQQRLLVGDNPRAVAVADLNGDGRLDIVTTNANTDDVSVLLGNGDGTFAAQQRFAVGDFPSAVTVAHVNGDSVPDLVVANQGVTDEVSVLIGNGDGTFQPQRRTLTGAAPVGVAVGDFDFDGKLDMATANSVSDDVSVLHGLGDGTFESQRSITVTTSTPRSVAAADLNRDGLLDLAIGSEGSSVFVLLGTGGGNFDPQQAFSASGSPTALIVADLNRDGILDLIAGRTSICGVSVLLGNGNGTFQAEKRLSLGGGCPAAIVAADLNGNGILDLATANTLTNDVAVLLGNGDGTFSAPQRFPAGSVPASLAVGDLNGDGKIDLVVANTNSDDISLLAGNGNGTLQPQQRFPVGDGPLAVAVADMNADGRLDIIAGNGNSNDVSLLFGNGGGTFAPQQRVTVGARPDAVAVADVNADGIRDIVVLNESSQDVAVLVGTGAGTFAPQQRFAVGNDPRAVAVGDLNGDGALDLVTANRTSGNSLSLLLQR
jgi:hypothetical protein